MKEYLKPEAEYISLVAQEAITDDDEYIDMEGNIESNTLFG